MQPPPLFLGTAVVHFNNSDSVDPVIYLGVAEDKHIWGGGEEVKSTTSECQRMWNMSKNIQRTLRLELFTSVSQYTAYSLYLTSVFFSNLSNA